MVRNGTGVTEKQSCALILLMMGDEHIRERKLFSEETLTDAKQMLNDNGIKFGCCQHCGEPSYLSPIECDCGRVNGVGLNSKKRCKKMLCGNCQMIYPPRHLKVLLDYYEKEEIAPEKSMIAHALFLKSPWRRQS